MVSSILMTQEISFSLPEKISTNKIYAGVHWRTRNKHKDKFRAVEFEGDPVTQFPVDITYDFKIVGRQLDSTNLGYMAKLVEDALVKKNILPDDSPKYVRYTTMGSEKADENICIITIKPISCG